MTTCTDCGLENANFYFDGSEYWCQTCYEWQIAEENELGEE